MKRGNNGRHIAFSTSNSQFSRIYFRCGYNCFCSPNCLGGGGLSTHVFNGWQKVITVIFSDPNVIGFVAILGSVVVLGVSFLGIRFTLTMRNKKK